MMKKKRKKRNLSQFMMRIALHQRKYVVPVGQAKVDHA